MQNLKQWFNQIIVTLGLWPQLNLNLIACQEDVSISWTDSYNKKMELSGENFWFCSLMSITELALLF